MIHGFDIMCGLKPLHRVRHEYETSMTAVWTREGGNAGFVKAVAPKFRVKNHRNTLPLLGCVVDGVVPAAYDVSREGAVADIVAAPDVRCRSRGV